MVWGCVGIIYLRRLTCFLLHIKCPVHITTIILKEYIWLPCYYYNYADMDIITVALGSVWLSTILISVSAHPRASLNCAHTGNWEPRGWQCQPHCMCHGYCQGTPTCVGRGGWPRLRAGRAPQTGGVGVSDEDHSCLLRGHWEPTCQSCSVTKFLSGGCSLWAVYTVWTSSPTLSLLADLQEGSLGVPASKPKAPGMPRDRWVWSLSSARISAWLSPSHGVPTVILQVTQHSGD